MNLSRILSHFLCRVNRFVLMLSDWLAQPLFLDFTYVHEVMYYSHDTYYVRTHYIWRSFQQASSSGRSVTTRIAPWSNRSWLRGMAANGSCCYRPTSSSD